MPQFNLPNIQTGGSQTITANTLQDAMNQASSAGTWNAGAGTYGANSMLGGGTPSPTGAGTPSSTTDMSALQQFAAQTSGVTQAQLAQQKAEFDAQLQFAQQQMQQLGIPQLQINQYLAQMQQQQFQSQLLLAQQAQQFNQAATTAGLTGYYTPPQPVPDISRFVQPNQPSITNPTAPLPGGTTAAGGAPATGGGGYNDAAKQLAFGFRASGGQSWPTSGAVPMNLSADQLNQVIKMGTSGAYGDYASLSGGQGVPGGLTWDQLSNMMRAANYSQQQAAAQQTPAPQATAQPPAGATGGTPGSVTGQPQMTMQLGQLLGQFNGMPTEQAREFNQNLALQQGQLGQQYLATAAQLQGPQNTFQLSNYLRGAQGNQSVPLYLQNLANNVSTPMFQGTGTVTPTLQTAAGLANQMGGGSSATPGWDYNQTLGAIQNIMGRPQTLAPGSLERLTPDELQALGSGIGAAGGTLPSFLAAYNASRVGQTAPTGMTSLA